MNYLGLFHALCHLVFYPIQQWDHVFPTLPFFYSILFCSLSCLLPDPVPDPPWLCNSTTAHMDCVPICTMNALCVWLHEFTTKFFSKMWGTEQDISSFHSSSGVFSPTHPICSAHPVTLRTCGGDTEMKRTEWQEFDVLVVTLGPPLH